MSCKSRPLPAPPAARLRGRPSCPTSAEGMSQAGPGLHQALLPPSTSTVASLATRPFLDHPVVAMLRERIEVPRRTSPPPRAPRPSSPARRGRPARPDRSSSRRAGLFLRIDVREDGDRQDAQRLGLFRRLRRLRHRPALHPRHRGPRRAAFPIGRITPDQVGIGRRQGGLAHQAADPVGLAQPAKA